MSQGLIKTINKKSNLTIPWIITILLIVVFLIVLILYIFQAGIATKANSLIENYRLKIEQLSRENKDLEITFSQKNSLKISKDLLEDLNFEKVTKIDYIRVLESSVAAK